MKFCRVGSVAAVLLVAVACLGQDAAGRFRVKFHDPKTEITETVLPVDPIPRIRIGYTGAMDFGLTVEGGKMLCCGDGAIRTMLRIDNRHIHSPQVMQRPVGLGKGPGGKPRPGQEVNFTFGNVHFKQVLEIVPSKSSGPAKVLSPAPLAPGQRAGLKRRLDTVLIRYIAENKDTQPHTVGCRVRIDTLCAGNDGALFASPTTHPGKILNGIEFKDKEMPEFVQILQNPDLRNPGFVGHFTLRFGKQQKAEPPGRFAMTAHGAAENGWDVTVVQSQGDSDAVVYWEPKPLPPGGKREMIYAYGQGIASNPENEGKVSVVLGGSFEPKKTFTVTAYIDEPIESQSLRLELPEGMERVEGKEVQPVPAMDEGGTSVVVWKGRVLRPGEYTFRVRSSNGVTQSRTVTISEKAE